jgi:glycogen phosphorylase
MSPENVIEPPIQVESQTVSKLLDQYSCGPIHFAGTDNGLYERHLLFDNVIDLDASDACNRFEAFARSVRDVLSQRWILTENTYASANAKQVYDR